MPEPTADRGMPPAELLNEYQDTTPTVEELEEDTPAAEQLGEDTTPAAEPLDEDTTPAAEPLDEDTTPAPEQLGKDTTPTTEQLDEDAAAAEQLGEDTPPAAELLDEGQDATPCHGMAGGAGDMQEQLAKAPGNVSEEKACPVTPRKPTSGGLPVTASKPCARPRSKHAGKIAAAKAATKSPASKRDATGTPRTAAAKARAKAKAAPKKQRDATGASRTAAAKGKAKPKAAPKRQAGKKDEIELKIHAVPWLKHAQVIE